MCAFAQTMQVTQTEAIHAATKAIMITCRNTSSFQPNIYMVIEKRFGNNVALYEIQFESGEHVIISGSKAARPVLALYNESDGYSWLQNIEERESGFSILIENMYQKIGRSFSGRFVVNEGWVRLDTNVNISTRSQYGPYLNTLWSQRYATDCGCKNMYNKYMPYSDGDCICNDDTITNYPSGCTVTALAQLMNYWQHPVLINHAEQIDWCNMPKKIKCGESSDTQNEAVARFYKILSDELEPSYGTLFDVLDIEIDNCYGYLNPASTVHKLQSFFNYSDEIDVIERIGPIYYFDPSLWESKIKTEITEGRPVLYWAFQLEENRNENVGAHTFVCDGYDDANELFHFNWGHCNEGWCSINYIEEDSNTHWIYNECAMIKIKPESQFDICNANLLLGDYYTYYYCAHIFDYSLNTPSQMLNPAPYAVTPQTMTSLTSASNLDREEFRTIPCNATAEYRAHEELHLRDGFSVERGAEFTAQIVPCANCENNRGVEDQSIVETGNEQEEPVPDMAVGRPSIATEGIRAETVLYPNPTDGDLTINVDGEVQSIVIYNAMGRPVGGWNLRAITPDHVTLDINPLATGT